MEKLSLHLVTLWHREKFLNVTLQELARFPSITRERTTLEQRREQVAQSRGIEAWPDYIHGRVIINLGKPVYTLRKTWIVGHVLAWVLKDFDVRFIHTLEQGTQARYKCEFRPDWGQEPGSWEPLLRRSIIDGIKSSAKLSIRQLWPNPIEGRFGTLPVEVPDGSVREVANLVVGPCDEKDSPRGARLTFEKHHT
jgi:hypothetical protein